MTKKHGKLNQDQLCGLLAVFSQIRKQKKELSTLSRKKWKNAYKKIGDNVAWSWCYEFTLVKHIMLLIIAMGQEKQLLEHAKSLDYDKIINEWAYSEIDIEEGKFSKDLDDTYRASLFFALQRSIESLETYNKSLNALVADVGCGIDSALFHAIRLDHSAISNPTIASRITRAELEDDKKFFKKLTNALDGRPKKTWSYYKDLRVILALLEETETLDSLSSQEAYQLFCIDLKIYPTSGKDPARSLQRYIQKWKINVRATPNRDFRSSPKE